MRKFVALVGIALVVGALAAGMSYLAADRAAMVHAELAQALQEIETVTVLSDRFDQGLMESSAEIHIEVAGVAGEWLQDQFDLAGLENARARFGLRFNVDLRHGPDIGWSWLMEGAKGEPIVVVAVSALTLDQETALDFATALGELSPITFVSEVRMTGAHQTSIVWEPADFENHSTTAPWTAQWRGLDGLLVRGGDGSLDGHLTGAGFDWQGVTGSLAVGGFDLAIKGRAGADGHWDGDIEQRWRDVVWTPAAENEADDEAPGGEQGDGRWAAHDLRIDHRSVREGEETDWYLDFRAAEGTINGAAMDSALMSLRLRPPSSEVSGAEAPAEGMKWLGRLLVPGLVMDPIQLELQGTTGSLSMAGRLEVDPGRTAAAQPSSLLDALVGEVEIETRGGVLSELGFGSEAIMAAWVEAGLATVNESGAVAHFSLRGGEYGEPEPEPEPEATTALPILAAGDESMADAATDQEEATPTSESALVPEPASAVAPPAPAPETPAVPAAIPDSPPAAQLEHSGAPSTIEVEGIAAAPMASPPALRPEKRAEAAEAALLSEMIAASDAETATPADPEGEPADRSSQTGQGRIE